MGRSTSIRAGNRTLLRIEGSPATRRDAAPTPAILSRFAFLRRDGARWVLESALSPARITLEHPSAFVMVEALSVPSTPQTLATAGDVPLPVARRVLQALSSAGFLTTASRSNGASAEDHDPALITWEFADLLLHSRSRAGMHEQPIGGTFPFREVLRSAPATKPRMKGTRVRLPRPDADMLAERDAPFSTVVDRRRSARAFGPRVLSRDEVGEFLFRAARITGRRSARGQPYDATWRPYPSGGACYPLEIYLATDRCASLRAGLHHYDPAAHALTSLPRTSRTAAQLLAEARAAVRVNGQPSVLVVLTARFRRVSWKYRAISYATILKDVGVLLQTMNLATTAMGLAGSAIGCGNAAVLALGIGEPIERESSVGEFLFGAPA